MTRSHALVLLLAVVALCALPPRPAAASPTLDDYRHFRALSIDLKGRAPTRAELAAFEASSFDPSKWIDEALDDGPYAERLTRVYMDLLRLEANPALQFAPDATTLYRHAVQGPDGKSIYVYYRARQRRGRAATDGEFCLTKDETGLEIAAREQSKGEPKPVSKAVLDQYTVVVRPWWLYRDYLNVQPTRRFKMGWNDPDPAYLPVDSLLTDPDGKPTTEVRVCKEEAQTPETGHVYTTGRAPPARGEAPPFGRKRPLPLDSAFAKQHAGEVLSCQSKLAVETSIECGCGVALEHCLPSDANQNGAAFSFPNHIPLGLEQPIDVARQSATRWYPFWWSQEAVHFLRRLFANDRDFREILTSRETVINGPLAQFYRAIQPGACCGPEAAFGMLTESEPLFSPRNVPNELFPHDVGAWTVVKDRGAHAAGILTMPIFLEKYASARARGATLATAFMCQSFVAENAELTPSTEPNLMVRPGCASCHARLEPLAAYFARIEPGNVVYLPSQEFPVANEKCKKGANGKLPGFCNAFYDEAFSDAKAGTLRSAYGSPAHADATPVGAARDVTASPEFAACAVQRITSSFLGRATTSDDAALLARLTAKFVQSGYRPKALVRAILESDVYRRANNEASAPPRAKVWHDL